MSPGCPVVDLELEGGLDEEEAVVAAVLVVGCCVVVDAGGLDLASTVLNGGANIRGGRGIESGLNCRGTWAGLRPLAEPSLARIMAQTALFCVSFPSVTVTYRNTFSPACKKIKKNKKLLLKYALSYSYFDEL